MNREPMTSLHGNAEAPWHWQLSAHEARRFQAAPLERWLAVQSGRVWLTRSRSDFDHPEDIWLQAGERQVLPAGTEWVAEGWPEAQVMVLEAPQ